MRDGIVIALVSHAHGGVFGDAQAVPEHGTTEPGPVLDIEIGLDGEVGRDVDLADSEVAVARHAVSRVNAEIG